ncbi:GAF domain-containing protein [Sporichthya polymorpha]|uniref:sensor histidine kinase n=1 Tax=Sporichthya polymorpha TaxID=35751 RepID=UPI000379E3C8|nr:GAF domain-containing protein [Sporichthya polymorpha]
MTGADPSSPLPQAPLLEFDQLLLQLVDRAQELMGTQSRLRGLLAANTAIIGNLALPVVLRRIVEVACDLVNARYGALGVLAPVGGLEEFIHVGMDDDAVERIGHLPAGKGLLGALIDDPQPIRLRNIGDDARSVGFPANHPPMASFLGVPIRVRDEVFGNLYLSESASGRFSEDDERVVIALAATAGVVIENARLFEQSKRRQDWLQASMQIQQRLMAPGGEDPLKLIARQARLLAEADLVSVVLPAVDPEVLHVAVASGDHSAEIVGYTYPREDSMVGLALQTGQPVMLGDAAAEDRHVVHLSRVIEVGPTMVVPLIGAEGTRGALTVARQRGRRRFDDADLDMALAFANHAAVALELADARHDQERVLLLEDRDRIARDLHDHVIQRLFAAGMTLQGAAGLREAERTARIDRVVTDIDDVIAQIRTSIFGLRGSVAQRPNAPRARLLEVVGEARRVLGFEPRVRFGGPVDTMVGPDLADDLVAVAREALSNAARHAQATTVELSVTVAADALSLEVVDDGVGLGEITRRSGLDNMRVRAEQYGGTLEVGPAPTEHTTPNREGTHLRWTIPL